jgi:branched-chain amino acid transport system substrate-binding protein
MRSSVLLAALLVTAAAVTGCAGSSRSPITIGVLSPCLGTFNALYEPTIAAAELPLLARGATPSGTLPSAGLHGATAAGSPVRIITGCSDGSAELAIREARRLVEREGAVVIVGAVVDPEGLALVRYAARHPEITFLPTSSDQSVTLQAALPNVFRFASDSAQSIAGLGSYAYDKLHWRRVVIVGQPTSFDYGEAAGFVTEFCSLGGDVVQRVWATGGLAAARAALADVPMQDIDGAAVFSLTGGLDLIRAFAPRGGLREKVVVDVILGGALAGAFGTRAEGVAWAWPTATDPQGAVWRRYVSAVRHAFPDQESASSPLAVAYYTSMEAVLRALATSGGDLSGEQRRFRSALAASRFASPLGRARLDRNRQLIATNRVALVRTRTGGSPVRTITGIDQSFEGGFPASGPVPGPQAPACRHGNPASWTS